MQSISLTAVLLGVALVCLGASVVWVIAGALKKMGWFGFSSVEPTAQVPSPSRYRLEPFPEYGELITLARFQELLKRYAMDSDTGWSIWATANGHWVDVETGEWVRVNVWALRAGEMPEPQFTHIWFIAK